MIISCISDTHGRLPEIDECDIFIHAGDICPAHNHTRGFQSNWLKDEFNPWLKSIPAKHKIVIAGNHDWIFYDAKKQVPELDCHYLEHESIEIEGLKFFGSPWTKFFCDWAFNFKENDRKQAERYWKQIPDDTDILITHGPPLSFGDSVYSMYGGTVVRAGDKQLRDRVFEIKPKIHVFGHIHQADYDDEERIVEFDYCSGGKTAFYNVSVLNEEYRLVGKPTVFEVENEDCTEN